MVLHKKTVSVSADFTKTMCFIVQKGLGTLLGPWHAARHQSTWLRIMIVKNNGFIQKRLPCVRRQTSRLTKNHDNAL
jgi:hypothetical protein